MNKISVKFIAESAIIAALYAALTWLLAPISYGAIQFRLSEVLVLLVVFKPKYAFALIVGCFIANTTSSLGWYDMLFGTLATTLAVLPMTKIKKLPIAAILPVVSNALIVSVELGFAFDMFEPTAFFFNVFTVGLGEAVVLYFVGIPVMYSISKNTGLVELLELDVRNISSNNRVTLTNSLSLALGAVGIVLFIAYPFSEGITSLNLVESYPWILLFAIIPVCYVALFLLLKGNAKLIITIVFALLLLIPLVLLGVNIKDVLSYPYYYGYSIYPSILIALSVFDFKRSNNNISFEA